MCSYDEFSVLGDDRETASLLLAVNIKCAPKLNFCLLLKLSVALIVSSHWILYVLDAHTQCLLFVVVVVVVDCLQVSLEKCHYCKKDINSQVSSSNYSLNFVHAIFWTPQSYLYPGPVMLLISLHTRGSKKKTVALGYQGLALPARVGVEHGLVYSMSNPMPLCG